MIVMKKKSVLQELAVALYLLLEFNTDTTSYSLVQRIRQRAQRALKDAETYTGTISDNTVQNFLSSKDYSFSVNCGEDIIRGDVIKFCENVRDFRIRPPRMIGKRVIIAEVQERYNRGRNAVVYLRVISSHGTWEIKADNVERRPVSYLARCGAMRAPWSDETLRTAKASVFLDHQNGDESV